MAEIGLRSGKVKAGTYKCGIFTIIRQSSNYWRLYKYYGSDHEVMVKQFNTLTDAYVYARMQRLEVTANV